MCKVDSEDLWQEYRSFGSGQAKLAFLKIDDAGESAPEYIEASILERLANEDQWQEFVKINVGHWANTSLRDMSIKAEIKDIYDNYYSWTSSFAHSSWAAVRNSVFGMCFNPLHRLHRVLLDSTVEQGDVVQDATIIADNILEIVNNTYGSRFSISE